MAVRIVAVATIVSFALLKFRLFDGNEPSAIEKLIPLRLRFVPTVATIHESLLGPWANLEQLDPTRVKHIGCFWEFKGPVWIVPNSKDLLVAKISLTVAATLFGIAFFNRLRPRPLTASPRLNKGIERLLQPIGLVAGATFGAVTWMLLTRVMPKTTGIFFLNRSSLRYC